MATSGVLTAMHEYSLVRALLSQVDALKREHDAQRVARIRVRVGRFSGVEPDLFCLAFETLVETTSARGAKLQMEVAELEARCDGCGYEYAVEEFRFDCPTCRCCAATVVSGEDLVLESVTLEQAETSYESDNSIR